MVIHDKQNIKVSQSDGVGTTRKKLRPNFFQNPFLGCLWSLARRKNLICCRILYTEKKMKFCLFWSFEILKYFLNNKINTFCYWHYFVTSIIQILDFLLTRVTLSNWHEELRIARKPCWYILRPQAPRFSVEFENASKLRFNEMHKAHVNPNLWLFFSIVISNVQVLVMTKE